MHLDHHLALCRLLLSIHFADDSLLPLLNLMQVALSTGNAVAAVDQSLNAAAAGERRRLFFAQAAADASEEHIKQWFSQYGPVESVQLFSEATHGSTSGYGYVTMATSEQAEAALAAVQQNPQMKTPVGFLNVSWPLDEAGAAAPAAAASATSPNPMSSLEANADRTVSNCRCSSCGWSAWQHMHVCPRSVIAALRSLTACAALLHPHACCSWQCAGAACDHLQESPPYYASACHGCCPLHRFVLLLLLPPLHLHLQVFFAKVPPTALASEVELLFGSFGKLAEVNLFRAWAGAKHSKVGKHTAHCGTCEASNDTVAGCCRATPALQTQVFEWWCWSR
jgi:hypothetical protein